MGRILVIEDELPTQLLMTSRLRDLGHQVITASNGAMGIMEARAHQFDLFLVDILLGTGIDGYEVCRRFKSNPQTRNIPVVLVSAKVSGREELHRGYEAGCEAYLIKGEPVVLEDVVRAMLRFKALQDDLATQNRLLDERNRRLCEAQARGAELEDVLRAAESPDSAFRDHSRGVPDGALIVDADGVVRYSDRGARNLLGRALEGKSLGSLAPATGLEAVVRDANLTSRDGHQFDIQLRGSGPRRTLNAVVVPMSPRGGEDVRPLRMVLLRDQGRRRVGAEMLRFEETAAPRRELAPLLDAARMLYRPSALVGVHPRSVELRSRMTREAASDRPVLIRGEEGVFRTFIARALHYGSERSGAYMPIDCGSVSPESLEAELFGYVKGAFPDATSGRPGLFQCAHLGTVALFAPEALPLELQRKVLHAVTEGEVVRVGGSEKESVDVRLIGIPELGYARSSFDEELFEVFSENELHVPPLRERMEDIPAFVDFFLTARWGHSHSVSIEPAVFRVFAQYEWPGNLRELKSVLDHATIRAEGAVLSGAQLPAPLSDIYSSLDPEVDDEIPSVPPRRNLPVQSVAPVAGISAEALRAAEELEREPVSFDLYERMALQRALRESGGDRLAAAKLLEVGKSTLYRKLKRYEIP